MSDNTAMQFRRIITGHNEKNEAIFTEDCVCPNALTLMGIPNFVATELWKTKQTPADNSGDEGDPAANSKDINPPPNGTILRIIEFVPDSLLGNTSEKGPMVHRTASLDYAVIIKGEIYAVLDNEEKLMKAGDVLIQRGTNHAWSNRSDETCVVLFVLIGAMELPGLPPQ
jgi:hypothetical protein